jgi:hypothetical protein
MNDNTTKTGLLAATHPESSVIEHLRLTRLVTLIAVLGLAASVTSVALANDLANANLDNTSVSVQNGPTPVGWSVDAYKSFSGQHFDGCSSEPWCNVQESGGFGLFFKPFQGTVGDEISVKFYQDNPATPNTRFTLSGYAAGEPNYSGFFNTNSPAPQTLFFIEFLDAGGTSLATNTYDLIAAGLPSGGPGSMVLFTTPQVTAPANTTVVRAGAWMRNAYSTTGGQSFFVDAFDLTSEAPPGSPVINNQPASATVAPGGNISFMVGVSNPAGVSYQWQFYNTNLANGGSISGATSPTLTITGASASDVGHYRALVSNSSGAVYSQTAALALMGLSVNPVIAITGKIGDTYRVDYSTAVAPTTWIPLSTNKLTSSPQTVIDYSVSGTVGTTNTSRFYRAVYLP